MEKRSSQINVYTMESGILITSGRRKMSKRCLEAENGSEDDVIMHESVFTSGQEEISSEAEDYSYLKFPAAFFEEDVAADDEVHELMQPSNFQMQPTHCGCESEAKQQQEITTMGGGCKQIQCPSTPNIQKGSMGEEISSDQQQAIIKAGADKKFVKIFSYKDEKKILKALHGGSHTRATSEFWRTVGHSLKLSVPVKQSQLYEKVRRLRGNYLKQSKTQSNSHASMSHQEQRLYKLSHKIWGEEAKPLPVKPEEEEEEEGYEKKPPVHVDYNQKFENFMAALEKKKGDLDFPVVKALNLLPASKRSKLEKKWKDLDAPMLHLHMRRIDLIQETMRAVVSSSSNTSLA